MQKVWIKQLLYINKKETPRSTMRGVTSYQSSIYACPKPLFYNDKSFKTRYRKDRPGPTKQMTS